MKKKSVIYKLLITFSTITSIILILVGLLLSIWINKEFFNQKKELVNNYVELIEEATTKIINNSDEAGYKDLVIDAASYNVIYAGEEIKMPPKEFELLHYLATNKNKVFTREQLLCEVWGYDYPGDSRTVDVHIKRLREKISGGANWQIETVWGVGYKFEVK